MCECCTASACCWLDCFFSIKVFESELIECVSYSIKHFNIIRKDRALYMHILHRLDGRSAYPEPCALRRETL